MARTLSPTLAIVVEELELDQPTVVTSTELSNLVERLGIRTEPKVIAKRLRANGWLLATGQEGVWEFAPGAHAGAFGRGDPVLPLRAALAADPGLDARLSLATAAWAHGAADRVPARIDVCLPKGVRAPESLRRATHVVSFTSNLDHVVLKGDVPTHRSESIVVQLATTPTVVRSWNSTLEWLPELAPDLESDRLSRELHGRPDTVRTRCGYLLSGLRPDLAEELHTETRTTVRFGPRDAPVVRYDATWRIVDTLLPSPPSTWRTEQ